MFPGETIVGGEENESGPVSSYYMNLRLLNCPAKIKPLAVLSFRRKAIVPVGFDAYRVIRPYCKLTKQM